MSSGDASISPELGVTYAPSAVCNTLSIEDLDRHNIEFIRLTWVDFTNIIRFRLIPIAYFKKMLASPRPGVSLAKACLGLVYTTLAAGFTAMGAYFLAPDMTSMRLCPYAPGHASVMAFIQEAVPLFDDLLRTSRVDTQICPRTILKRIVDDALVQSGSEFLVGFESEFTLLKNDDPVEVVGTHPFSSASSLRTGSVAALVVDKIARALKASGIELQMCHGEAGPGQYEVITGPLAPLEAADALIHTREIIYNTAASHGLRATFAPRVLPNGLGSGAHAHVSVHQQGAAAKPQAGLSPPEAKFLAGVLRHLPALPALTLPVPASYRRVGDGVWAGGTHVCWGTENREAPVRLVSPRAPAGRRFEMRFLDGTANPHLALAGIVGAGALGVRLGYELTTADCAGPKTAAEMGEDERQALGIVGRMPRSWEEARRNFCEDRSVSGVILNTEMAEMHLSVTKVLGEALEAGHDEWAKLRRLIELY